MKIKSLIILTILTSTFSACKKEGPEGKKSLLDMVIEPKGANCSSGGYKVVSGVDLNNNNALDAIEIQSTKYLCNGNDGTNGNNSLMNVIPELVGTNCSSGGFKMTTGIDLNKNNMLDTNEIQNTQYICNGDNGGKYDKQIRIYFPANGYGYATSSTSGNIEDIERIFNFDITNYLNADSIVFGSYLQIANASATCSIELYDNTNNTAINNTLLSSTATAWEWKTTSANFINDLPKSPITLAIRVKTNQAGIGASYYLPMLTIYRK